MSEEILNTGILIKCLQENFAKGKNQYTIHEDWMEISDIEKLKEIVEKGYLLLDNTTISFTEKGKETITELYKEPFNVRIENIYSHLKVEAKRIIEAFQ